MPKKILLIEDEEDIILLLSGRLKASGYEVITAGDGLQGLEKARSESPDLIILDVGLPKMNGFVVCRMLKFDDKFKSIPIIMLTARSQEKDVATGKEVGADVYIPKPFEPQDLVIQIEGFLKKAEG